MVIVVLSVSLSCGIPASLIEQPSATPVVVTATTAVTQTPYIIVVTSAPEGAAATTVAPTVLVQTAPPLVAATTAPSPTSCEATIKANQDANIRSGPGTVYEIVGFMRKDNTAKVTGKNNEGSWWYIEYADAPGGHAWVAGSITTGVCIPPSLAVITAPPTPLPPSGTCKGDYVWRLIKSSDKVCVSPASKAQADADNAAASSRTVISDYGPDSCASGYVWREAYSGDHVCVTPANKSQAASDNAAASGRWTSGAYGPHTCISGYVWREARSGDDVCVTPTVHNQVQTDNAAANSRLASTVYGSDACKSGYTWRKAFAGDRVCVTPDVKAQVQADNADAPNHTW